MNANEILESWLEAVEARDPERIVGALADDVELRFDDMARRIVGKDAMRALLGSLRTSYEVIQIEREATVASGNEIAALVRGRVKFQSDADVLGETLPTAGKELCVTAALFLTIDDAGKIAKVRRVRDNLGVLRQLGISPERMQALMDKVEQRLAA